MQKFLDIEQIFGTFVHFIASLVRAAVVLGVLHANLSEGHLFITEYNLRGSYYFLKDVALYNSHFCCIYFVTVNLLVTLLFWY